MLKERKIVLSVRPALHRVQGAERFYLQSLFDAVAQQKGIVRAHMKRVSASPVLCVHYDAAILNHEDVRHLVGVLAQKMNPSWRVDQAPAVEEVASKPESTLQRGEKQSRGIANLEDTLAKRGRLVLSGTWSMWRVRARGFLGKLGSLSSEELGQSLKANRELLFSLLAGFFLIGSWLGGYFPAFPASLSLTLALLAYLIAGFDITRHALVALRKGHFDTDLLMILAALGAALLGEYIEGALLLFLFSLGHALEERALGKAHRAIEALAELAPKVALVKRGSEEHLIPVDELAVGDVIIVKPGVRVPVDGVVIAGRSGVDQSPVTGESAIVDKSVGDEVFAGSVNAEGVLEVRVVRPASESTLARVVKMVEQAQSQKSRTQQLTEKFEGWFVPVVLASVVLLIVLPPLFGMPFKVSFMRAMTLLVAASPCALALGTPSAVLAGIARAARNGVLIKGGAHLENLGNLKAIAFDKTGTLTVGKPMLTDIVAFPPHNENHVLEVAASVERRSAHPLAQAVVSAAEEGGLPIVDVDDVVSVTGLGIKARLGKVRRWVGSLNLFAEARFDVRDAIKAQIAALEAQGKTTMLVAEGDALIGMIATSDVIRPKAPLAIAALKDLGIQETIMLTGDNQLVARRIAKQVGLSKVRANLMPEDKLNVIGELNAVYHHVAMVGDGVNDAPALANASLGIAMGGARTDVALETADVVLMGDDLSQLPFAIGLGKAARRVIFINLVISLGVIIGLVIMALTGLAGIGWAIVFHEGSTLVVVLNALRLLNYRHQHDAEGFTAIT